MKLSVNPQSVAEGQVAASALSWFPASRFSRNVGWNVLGNAGGKFLGPLFQLFVARLLVPADFGVFAISTAWLAVFEIGKDWGLSQAIVVRRGGTREISLQFTAQLGAAVAFNILTLLAAPAMSYYFKMPQLVGVLPLMAMTSFITAVADPLLTDCFLKERYQRLALRQVVTPIAIGVIGLLLAYRGYGVYSLVVGLVLGQAAGALSLALGSNTRLKLLFDWNLMKDLLGVGKHVVLQRLFGFLVGQADSLILGRAMGSQAVGNYRMGNMLAFLAPSVSVTQAQQVVFNELSANHEKEHFRRRYGLYTNVGGVFLLLYSIIVYFAAPTLIPAVLGAQWLEAVPMMQVFAAVVVTGFLTPLNMDLAKIMGFAGTYTRYAAVRSLATALVVVLAARHSILAVVVSWVVVGFVSNLVNDAIFYRKQKVVPLTRVKVAIVLASWTWAAFVIARIVR